MKTKPIIKYGWPLIILFFSYQMFQIVWPYTTWEWNVDFLQTKAHIVHLSYYRIAFYLHIFSSLIVLASGAFLFSNQLLKKQPKLHRQLGKTYVGLLLFISAPSGLIMAFHANGGFFGAIEFSNLNTTLVVFYLDGIPDRKKKAVSNTQGLDDAKLCFDIVCYYLTLIANDFKHFLDNGL